MKKIKMSNGFSLPSLGYGTFLVSDKAVVSSSIKCALNSGYKHFDTALVYMNEDSIGKVLNDDLNLKREQYFLTTKYFPSSPNVSESFIDYTIRKQLKWLKTDTIDLYLLHAPVGENANYMLWKTLEKYYEKGIFKSIGVSNYARHHLEDLLSKCKIKPHMNQIHISPYYVPKKIIRTCEEKDIKLTAYSMFKSGELEEEKIIEIGRKYNKSPGQVILRWGLQRGFMLIPKSVTPKRIKDNINIFDFKLSSEDMKVINSLNKGSGQLFEPSAIVLGGRTW